MSGKLFQPSLIFVSLSKWNRMYKFIVNSMLVLASQSALHVCDTMTFGKMMLIIVVEFVSKKKIHKNILN